MKLTTVDGLTHAARIPAQWAALAVRTCECGQRFYVQVAGITECDDCLAGDAARWPTYYATTRGTTINRNEDTVKKTATKTKKTAAAPKKNALPIAKPGAVPKLVTGRLVTTGVKRDELPAEQRPSTAAERAAKKDAYIAKAAALPSTQTLSATIAANNARVVAAMKAGGVKVGQALTPGQLAKLTAAAQPDAVAAAVTAAPASFTGPDAKAKAERFAAKLRADGNVRVSIAETKRGADVYWRPAAGMATAPVVAKPAPVAKPAVPAKADRPGGLDDARIVKAPCSKCGRDNGGRDCRNLNACQRRQAAVTGPAPAPAPAAKVKAATGKLVATKRAPNGAQVVV